MIMKKIISIKIIYLVIIAFAASLQSCREYEEENYPEKNKATVLSLKYAKDQLKPDADTIGTSPEDPPVKGGTHWK